jgi:CRP-like cAMP-binding protein
MRPNDFVLERFSTFVERAVAPMTFIQPISDILASKAVMRNLSKGSYLLEPGQVVEHLYFIDFGLLRYYNIDNETGEERTGQFFDAGTVYTDVKSFVTQAPSRQFIQALESSAILCIPRKVIYDLYSSEHALERFGRLMIEQALIGSQQRTSDMMSQSIEQRYLDLMSRRQDLVQRIPQYLLASYLGVTPEALSRIRRRALKEDK